MIYERRLKGNANEIINVGVGTEKGIKTIRKVREGENRGRMKNWEEMKIGEGWWPDRA